MQNQFILFYFATFWPILRYMFELQLHSFERKSKIFLILQMILIICIKLIIVSCINTIPCCKDITKLALSLVSKWCIWNCYALFVTNYYAWWMKALNYNELFFCAKQFEQNWPVNKHLFPSYYIIYFAKLHATHL